MQLNIYVPKGKEELVKKVERLARKTHQSKNELILSALEHYVEEYLAQEIEFGVYSLGVRATGTDRDRLYREHLDRKVRIR
ncbi:MAG: ribbon-helix-helix domain-containing protein [Candidatus Bipolaricaulota bacterium]|nr:ribbon-helix-helix domain-containing protein [Candidatus Bipolaricaulota bacterium]MDW8030707.1 ribbon-helix-helix protein, CopG family [Candidatus Bipolaricaulota bacterium]